MDAAQAIEPFHLNIDENALTDLRQRLAATRWPERETVDDWSQGVPLDRARALCDYWRDGYDWRRCEAMLNGFGQYRTKIDGHGIHFLHIRSPEPAALPLVMTHGWPGSIVEFHKVIAPLTDPVAHGGRAEDAFHLVLPSLPGYGFSDRPAQAGWGVERIASAWIELMARLGYDAYGAQGGDWGSSVTTKIGQIAPAGLRAIHLNMPLAFPGPDDAGSLDPAEQEAAARLERYNADGAAYARVQATRPQTLGYGLADSPAGQAAWIYEKLQAWTDCEGDPETVLSRDEMLDNIALYWLTGTGASSARLYWESMDSAFFDLAPVHVPTGCSLFPAEIFRPSRRLVERRYPNLIHWNEPERGGHFAAWEQPDLFVTELRDCFRTVR
ncbi:epoxide hydrolase family protein [Sphingomonas profundi]|uniref:epoxide hydrolase family protein n=1 Tax=Alterirhizorhabdus profundi TaxID=2681549 RepID=UPI0012E887F3|nr:epoxide hydrolase [Sphingomonas profundi]